MSNLFYNNDISSNIEIRADNILLEVLYQNNNFKINYYKNNSIKFTLIFDYYGNTKTELPLNYYKTNIFKFYKYKQVNNFQNKFIEYLLPPDGKNLLNLLIVNKELKKLVNGIFLSNNFRLMLRSFEKEIEIVKYKNSILIIYPYPLISETLRKYIFYLITILSNKSSILIFEEPETHLFPKFIKRLAEMIALDDNTQYFISTHNPYMLRILIEKTLKKDLKIYLTYYEDYSTKIKSLIQKDFQKIIDFEFDPFFNIDKYI